MTKAVKNTGTRVVRWFKALQEKNRPPYRWYEHSLYDAWTPDPAEQPQTIPSYFSGRVYGPGTTLRGHSFSGIDAQDDDSATELLQFRFLNWQAEPEMARRPGAPVARTIPILQWTSGWRAHGGRWVAVIVVEPCATAFWFTVPNEGLLGRQPTTEIEMNIIRSSSLATVLLLSITVPVHAQNPKQGDYYQPQQATPQQATPGQEQKTQQGDYYKPGTTTPQQLSPAEAQETKRGDYYKPGSK